MPSIGKRIVKQYTKPSIDNLYDNGIILRYVNTKINRNATNGTMKGVNIADTIYDAIYIGSLFSSAVRGTDS